MLLRHTSPAAPDEQDPIRRGVPDAHALRSCPFCAGPPAWEPHPDFASALRIRCGGSGCGVRPATEYLLREFAGDLANLWNARA
jgi:hypothetical protein